MPLGLDWRLLATPPGLIPGDEDEDEEEAAASWLISGFR